MKIGISAAVLAVGMTGVATGQMSGVSHPEQVPILTNEDGIKQPVVYSGAVPAQIPDRTPAAVATVPTGTAAEAPPGTKPSAMVPMEAAVAKPAVTAAATEDVKLNVRPDIDAGVVTRVAGPSNALPVGTMMKAKITQDLSTKTTAVGTTFTAELTQAILRDGRVLLPAGSTVAGRVSEVHGGKRVSGQASMRLMPQRVTLPDGTIYPLHAQVIDTELYKHMSVDREGTILHKGSKTGTAAGIGLSAGAGAASGAIFGGWPGAIIGAGVGAGVSTVVWLKQDRQAELPAGTGITFMLTEAMVADGNLALPATADSSASLRNDNK
jgi:hypothetical protein